MFFMFVFLHLIGEINTVMIWSLGLHIANGRNLAAYYTIEIYLLLAY